jgi:prevent-host-death family protein
MSRKNPSSAAAAQVSVGELKNRLSEYLHAAETGRTITVVSHRRAVARLVPPTELAATRVRKALRPFGTTRFPLTGTGRTDSTALLLEERRKDRR